MTDDKTTPETTAAEPEAPQVDDEGYQYLVGDKIHIPTHNGKYVAVVVHRYKSLEEAEERYQGSYRTILQSPYGKPDPKDRYYYCEVANTTRKPLGVAEQKASLKWREPAPEAEAGA